MTAEEFLNDLARQNLVPGDILGSLRQQVAKAAKPVAPQTLAKLLVDKGHLTAGQSQRLLGVAAGAAAAPAKKNAPAPLAPLGPLDDLGLTPLDDLLTPLDDLLTPLDDLLTPLPAEPAVPAKPAAAPAKPMPKPAAKPAAAAAPAKPMAPLDDLGLTPLDDLLTPLPAPAPAKSPAAAPKPAAKPAALAAPAKAAAPAAKATAPAAKPKAAAAPAALQPLDGLEPLGEAVTLDMPLEGDLFGAPAGVAAPGAAAADPFAAAKAGALSPGAADPFAQAALTPQGAVAAAPAAKKKGSGVLGVVIGLVVLLVVAGGAGAAFFLIPRETGDKEFAAAEQDYLAKQYAAAIEKFDVALQRYPRSPQAGLAKVHRGMAKLLTASSSPADWPAILPVAKEVLPPLAADPELSQIHAELAPMLTDMADGLTTLAAKGKNADEITPRIAQARDALALTSDARLVPGPLRQWQRLASAEESLAVLEYTAKRSSALEAAVAAMKQAAGGGKTDAAYAERNQLLLAYPDLAGNPELRDAGQQIAQAEAARVTAAEDKGQTAATEAVPAIVASVAFAAPQVAAAANSQGQNFYARAGGSIWALEGATGKLLWRRPVGVGDVAEPVAVTQGVGSDLLLVDSAHSAVLRVAAATGALKWRRSFDSPPAGAPLVVGQNIVVTTRSGRIVKLAAASGNTAAAAQLPQGARLASVAAATGNHVYQLADHSHLYTLSTADLKCAGAIYLGHEPASVTAPPLIVGKHLAIADNQGAADATLHVVALDQSGLPQGVVQRVEIPGHVLTSPVVLGEHLVVLTDRGSKVALEITSSRTTPLQRISDAAAPPQNSLARFGLVQGEKLLVAESGLRQYALEPSGGNLKETWSVFATDVLTGPPQLAGDAIFCVRRDASGPGAIAAAVQASTGKPLWQTRIAAPLASGPIVAGDGQSAMAVSTLGVAAKVDLANWQGASVREFPAPAGGQASPPRIAAVVVAAGGELVLVPAGTSSQLLALSPDASAIRKLLLPGPLAGRPTPWGNGILLACASGDIHLLNPASGAPLADPFQIPTQPGKTLSHCSLTAAGADGVDAVLSDGQLTLRQLGVEKAPQPHLAELASAKLPAAMISPVAASGQHVFVLDQTGELCSFTLPGLVPAKSWKLDAAAAAWGPARMGNNVLLATDRDELWCFDAEPKQLWKVPLSHGPLAGSPIEFAGKLVLATRSGTLYAIAADTGKELVAVDLGQSIAGAPAAAGQSLLVPTADGCLLKVTLSAEGSTSP